MIMVLILEAVEEETDDNGDVSVSSSTMRPGFNRIGRNEACVYIIYKKRRDYTIVENLVLSFIGFFCI